MVLHDIAISHHWLNEWLYIRVRTICSFAFHHTSRQSQNMEEKKRKKVEVKGAFIEKAT
jgi:hypothetical protein